MRILLCYWTIHSTGKLSERSFVHKKSFTAQCFPFVFNVWCTFYSQPQESKVKMEEFLDKILPFLLVFGLIASNAVNGGPLQDKMKKGKISNCSSQLKAYIRLYLWLNRNQKKAYFEECKTLPYR